MSYNKFHMWTVAADDDDSQIALKEQGCVCVFLPPYEDPEDEVEDFYLKNDHPTGVATRWVEDERSKPVPSIFQDVVRVYLTSQQTISSSDNIPCQGRTLPFSQRHV